MTSDTKATLFVLGFIAVLCVVCALAFLKIRRYQKRLEADSELKSRHEERERAATTTIQLVIYGGIVLWGASVFVKQMYTYLRSGEWVPRSLIDLMQMFDSEWAVSPNDWIGLYRILDATPLSIALIVAGLLLAAVSD